MRTTAHSPAIGPEQPRKIVIAVPQELEMTVPNGSEISKRRACRGRADGLGRRKSDDCRASLAGPSLKFQRSHEKRYAGGTRKMIS